MKIFRKSLVQVVFALTVPFVLTLNVAAQCVRCKPSGSIFVCAPGTTGGCECYTTGSDCIISIPCAGHVCGMGKSNEPRIKIDEASVWEIAQNYPRFAVALKFLNSSGGIKDWADYSYFPTQLETREVINWPMLGARPGTAAMEAFFHAYRQQPVDTTQAMRIEFVVTKADDSRSIIHGNLTGDTADARPTQQLEIELNNGRVVNWKVY